MRRYEVERWFNERRKELGDDKTKQIAVWFASRCAMRVAPVAFFENVKQDKISFIIAVFRANTASWVACNRPTHDEDAAFTALDAIAIANANDNSANPVHTVAHVHATRAADAAAIAVDAAAALADAVDTAAFAIHNAAATADAAADAAAAHAAAFAAAAHAAAFAAFAAAEEDLKWLERGDYQIAESSPPLWHDVHNPLKKIWEKGRSDWQEAHGNPYAFFIDHYDRILRGDVPDWPILEALASKEAIEVWRTKDIHKIAYYIQKLKLDRG